MLRGAAERPPRPASRRLCDGDRDAGMTEAALLTVAPAKARSTR
jgi:hypothetical protein